MSDIVERLRREGFSQLGTRILDPLAIEAAAEIDLLRAEVERLREALDRVLVGGNHLGLLIGADHPPFGADNHAAALTHYGAGQQHEIWCCWNAIMMARRAVGDERDGG